LKRFDGVFHGTFSQLPLRMSVPAVVSIADLSFELHPEGYSAAKRRVFQLQARHAARTARRIITLSRSTEAELVDCYGVDPDRISIIPFGVEPQFDPARAIEATALCEGLGVKGRYIVAMGGASRRGLEVAVEAWRRVRLATDVNLVVVGSERPPLEPRLVYAGAVNDRTWAALLAGAEAFCYPTRYEGFGVPALESMASGTPVVCAPVKSLPEVLGEAAEWCEAPTVDAIAAGLRRLLDDPEHADALRRCGLQRAAARPGWEHTADILLSVYREAYRQ
jgi:alpha-1,3-rhamnosyl/mannosyltransferase